MSNRTAVEGRGNEPLLRCSALLLAFILAPAAPGLVSTAGAQARPSSNGNWDVPRTPDGHPDLQGNWTNVTLTPFQREEGRGPFYTPAEVREIEQPEDDLCPPNPGSVACGRPARDGSSNEARLSGQEYNEVYWDRGSRVAMVDGEYLTSLVTNPANGRRPPLTAEGEQRMQKYRDFRGQFGQYDHPELRPLAERCIVSFGSSAGPPMIPNSAYNNNYTIVQTADYLVINAEMVHDVRIIKLGEPEPLPAHIRPWLGDSWGHWEGDALVVVTTNLHPQQTFLGIPPTEHMKVTERFTRADENTFLYEFTIEDPTTYTQPWGGVIPYSRFNDKVYEYACHEGNYSLSSVLSGARYQERQERMEGQGSGDSGRN
jgi:hypothetical protein